MGGTGLSPEFSQVCDINRHSFEAETEFPLHDSQQQSPGSGMASTMCDKIRTTIV